jgi:putative DNA primase/helicase
MLYQTYVKWCSRNNERVMSQKWLGMRMSEKGFKRVITGGLRQWCGLAVKLEWK